MLMTYAFMLLCLSQNMLFEHTSQSKDILTETSEPCDDNNTCLISTTLESGSENVTKPMLNVTENPEMLTNLTDIIDVDNETTTELSANTKTTVIPSSTSVPDSATTIITTTLEPSPTAREITDELCTCDLTTDLCDINCCCDPSCWVQDREVFSGCQDKAAVPLDPRYCYQTHFIYHHNTQLKLVRDDSGLFCIVRDNLRARFQYHNRKIVTALAEFNKLYRSRKVFSWPHHNPVLPAFDPSIVYKAGELIWTLTNSSYIPLALPIRVTSTLCQTSNSVRYLNNWSGRCGRLVGPANCETQPYLGAATYYKPFNIVAVPQLVNQTLFDQFSDDYADGACVPVMAYLCPGSKWPDSLEDCRESVPPAPVYHLHSRTCRNVVRQLEYLIHHNGTWGITRVDAYFQLVNLSASQQDITQSFGTTFIWAENNGKGFQRSGNPGYVIGKPVIAGKKLTKIFKDEDIVDLEAIELGKSPASWLTIPKAMPDGKCNFNHVDASSRYSVTFGDNRRSMCALSLQASNVTSAHQCTALQRKLLVLLAGEAIQNVTDDKLFNRYVATFGDSRVEETGDWVRIILDGTPPLESGFSSNNYILVCKNVVTSLHIEILYASVGNLANPQAKIVGVAFRFGHHNDLVFNCAPLHCTNASKQRHQIEVVSTVTFIDITKPSITYFAEPPVYEIKLPHDFFYPFLSNSLTLTFDIKLILLMLATLLILNEM